jgi:hypothetical protein
MGGGDRQVVAQSQSKRDHNKRYPGEGRDGMRCDGMGWEEVGRGEEKASGVPFLFGDKMVEVVWLQELRNSRCRDGCRDQRVALQVALQVQTGGYNVRICPRMVIQDSRTRVQCE